MGDDAFCYVAAQLAATEWNSEIRFLAKSLPELPYPAVASGGGFLPDTVRSCIEAIRADTILQFGGSTLTRLTRNRRIHMHLARAGVSQLLALGVSIGPFDSKVDSYEVRRYLRACSKIAVRDFRSAEWAAELGLDVYLGVDPAILLARYATDSAPVNLSTENQAGTPILLVSLGHDHRWSERNGARLNLFRDALKRSLRDGVSVRVLVACAHPRFGDEQISHALASQLSRHGDVNLIPYSSNPAVMFGHVRRATAVLGFRLHASVFAYAAEKPFIQWNYHEKCQAMIDRLGCDPASLLDDSASVNDLASAIDSSLRGRVSEPSVPLEQALIIAEEMITLNDH